jgi:protein-arginine kinase activator protein McsA
MPKQSKATELHQVTCKRCGIVFWSFIQGAKWCQGCCDAVARKRAATKRAARKTDGQADMFGSSHASD